MDKVQVHPTGLVDPKDPTAKTKFLAAEALRGEGGLLLNSKGKRFCDDLGHRDYVSGMMWEREGEGQLAHPPCAQLQGLQRSRLPHQPLLRPWPHEEDVGKELAKEIGCQREGPPDRHSRATTPSPRARRRIQWNKKYFHNMPFDVDDTFHVAHMEPVLHFTMGGIEINDQAQCLNCEGKPFDGLFVCGELAGGVHGANRLGGSSLLGCVVYGRVAGDSASKYLFQQALSSAVAQPSRVSAKSPAHRPITTRQGLR